MEKFINGDIVVLPFPYSDLTDFKKRPALVVADLEGDDIILCQITSQYVKDNYSIPLKDSDLRSGKLVTVSNIRPNRIFTADKNIIIKKTATIKKSILQTVINKIIELLNK